MKSAVLLLAPGFEEVEAVTPIDFLRRADIQVTVLAVGGALQVEGSHQISLKGDLLIEKFQGMADAIIVPGGGGGSKNLAASKEVSNLIQQFHDQGRLICAICAAPVVVLEPLGLLDGKQFTCYPGMEGRAKSAHFSANRVVRDGQLITSRGPGTAAEFSIAIIEALQGAVKAQEIHQDTVQKN